MKSASNPADGIFGSVGARTVIAVVGVHVAIALVLALVPKLSTLHALAAIAVGCWWAATKDNLEWAAMASAYVAGSEVLWRMTQAAVFWEWGKYACCLIWIVALARMNRRRLHRPAIAYFMLLLPSVVFTLSALSLSQARQEISFNLSGPLALATGMCFFLNVAGRSVRLDRVLLALIAPATSTATVQAYHTLTATTIRFTGSSNFVTSGGFGPNQVSAILGAAAFVTCFWLLAGRPAIALKLTLFALVVLFGVQSALTFSRGGLYGAGGAMLFSVACLMKDPRRRIAVLIIAPVLALVVSFVVLPALDDFTGGALSARFRKTNVTHRDEIALADVRIWEEHPVFGLGPGMAKYARGLSFGEAAAHTEFSRLLSEHGVFGLLAFFILLGISRRNLLNARGEVAKALVLGAAVWTFLFMLANGMRLAVPGFMFGLCCARWWDVKRSRRWRVLSVPVTSSSIPAEIVSR